MKARLALLLAFLPLGCHAQIKPTSYQVDLSWTAPVANDTQTGCTTATPCTYVASRITLAAGVTTCPAANLATPNYTQLNASSPVSTLTFNDTAAAGLNVCYIVQTEQGTAVSQPSNVAGPYAVPSGLGAPSLSGNTTTAKVNPLPIGNSVAPVLTAKLTPVR